MNLLKLNWTFFPDWNKVQKLKKLIDYNETYMVWDMYSSDWSPLAAQKY